MIIICPPPVLLCGDGGGEMDDNHLEHGLSSREPVPHNSLHQGLALLLQFIVLQDLLDGLAVGCGQLAEQLGGLLLLEVHDGVEHHVDGVQHVHHEGPLVVLVLGLAPLLCLGVEEVLSPELLHHLVGVHAELAGVHLGELLEGEGPAVEPGPEADGAVVDIHTDDTHGSVVVAVGGDNDVHVLDDPLEGLVELLLAELQLQQGAVHLVHEQDGTDPLGDGLTQDSLGLDTHTYKQTFINIQPSDDP